MQDQNYPELLKLRDAFRKRGFDLRFVGGCVRDSFLGQEPKDIDFCTDAFPEEALAIYEAEGFSYLATGEQHGTYTVMFNGTGYEITSLRTESEHDGRYAKMTYTRDWTEDLSRRDLTFNSMAMTFGGDIVDPFNGREDLTAKRVRFVGDPNERMQEDYLRIMRYFRFLGRFANEYGYRDEAVEDAIFANREGLKQISAERIWSELKRILAAPTAGWVYVEMYQQGVLDVLGLPFNVMGSTNLRVLSHNLHGAQYTSNPVTKLCTMLTYADVSQVAERLKWSKEERELAETVMHMRDFSADRLFKAITVEGRKSHMIAEAAKYHKQPFLAMQLASFVPPKCPVSGVDLLNAGMKPGPEVGETIKRLKEVWWYSQCQLTKDELLELAAKP